MGVAVGIDPNTVLSLILKEKPKSTLSDYLKFAGQYADTNFFMREIKEYNFGDTNVMDRFKAANAERDNLSKNLIIMQALESLMGLPAAYRAQIEEANKGLEQGLNWTMLQSEFFRVGDAYVRQYTNHLGKTERQILPAYPFFNLPDHFMKFPEIRSAEGKKFDMSNIDGLLSANLGSGELQTMVNLARNKIDSDFRTTYYDPRVRVDYESALAIGTGGLDHLSQSAHAFIADANYTTCWGKSVEECGNSALKAGYLVGDVSGGEFGKHHFISFYTILKKKQEYDQKRGASQAVKERRKAGISNLHRDIATGYKLGQQSGQKNGMGHLGSEMAGIAGAMGGLMFSFQSVMADAFSELLPPGNPLEIALSQAHYKKEMYIEKNLGANDKYRVGRMTEAVAKGDAVTDTIITVGATVAAIAAVAIGAIVDIAAGGATLGAGMALGTAAAGSIMMGLAGYKAARGLYEGGAAGAVLQGGTAYLSAKMAGGAFGSALQGLTVDAGYSHAGGFNASVGVNPEWMQSEGISAGLSYNEQTGFGVNAGYQHSGIRIGGSVSGSRKDETPYGSLSLGYNHGSGFGVNTSYDYRTGSTNVGLSHMMHHASGVLNQTTTGLNWNSQSGFSTSLNYSFNPGMQSFEEMSYYDQIKRMKAIKDQQDAMGGLMQSMGNNIANVFNGIGSVVSGMWRDDGKNPRNIDNDPNWRKRVKITFGGEVDSDTLQDSEIWKNLSSIAKLLGITEEEASFIKTTQVRKTREGTFIDYIGFDGNIVRSLREMSDVNLVYDRRGNVVSTIPQDRAGLDEPGFLDPIDNPLYGLIKSLVRGSTKVILNTVDKRLAKIAAEKIEREAVKSFDDFVKKFEKDFDPGRPDDIKNAWKAYNDTFKGSDNIVVLGSKTAKGTMGQYADTPVAIGWKDHLVQNYSDNFWSLAVQNAWLQGAIDSKKIIYLASPLNDVTRLNKYGDSVFKKELDTLHNLDYIKVGDYMVPPNWAY